MLDPALVPDSLHLSAWITLTAVTVASITRVLIAWITKRLEARGQHETAVMQTSAFAAATLQASIKDLERKLSRISAANDRLEKRADEAAQESLRQELRAVRAEHTAQNLQATLEDIQRRFALATSTQEREITHLREIVAQRDAVIAELRQRHKCGPRA